MQRTRLIDFAMGVGVLLPLAVIGGLLLGVAGQPDVTPTQSTDPESCRHVDANGFCHAKPDPCAIANEPIHHANPAIGEVRHHQEWTMAALLCFGVPLLGSREAVLDEVAMAHVSTFTLNETSYTFAFPHVFYRRIFYPEGKILNVAQPFEERKDNEKRLRTLCEPACLANPSPSCSTACLWARSWGNGVPMLERRFGRDVRGVIADTGTHIGTECVYMAKRFVNAHILCVEPLPRNVFYTKWNLMANGLDASRVTIVPKLLAKQSSSEAQLLDWGLLTGSTEGAWASYHEDVSAAPGEVHTMYNPNNRQQWRQAVVHHVGSTSLHDLAELARPHHPDGKAELLFLRLNCEGCEFEVMPALLEAGGPPPVRYIGGEIHASCTSADAPTLEQVAIGGAIQNPQAIRDTYEALCTDALWPSTRRDFYACERYDSLCASAAS